MESETRVLRDRDAGRDADPGGASPGRAGTIGSGPEHVVSGNDVAYGKDRLRQRPDVIMLGLRSVGAGQGGVETHVDNLARELDDLGVTMEIVTRSPYQNEPEMRGMGTRIKPIWSPRTVSLEAIVHSTVAIVYAALRRPRLVHIHAIGPSIVAPLARLLGLRVVMTHHGEDFRREKWGRIGKLVLRIGEAVGARFSNGRIVISPSLREPLSRKYDREFRYIPNGVSITGPVSTTQALEKFGLERGRYILCVGRLVPEKRQLDLADALPFLDDTGVKLVLAGTADHASAYSRAVVDRATHDPRIVLAGFQTGQSLAELFSHAGTFALPSSHEGLPIALLEAMAYGNPVVASDIEANRNVGLPGPSYFPCSDITALGKALNVSLREGQGGARKDWGEILADFRWPDVAAQTLAVYRNVSPGLGMSASTLSFPN